jgi:hypothetical protein
MKLHVHGVSAFVDVSTQGRLVIGIPTAEELAVDLTTNLETDDDEDLLVSAGVSWVGVTARKFVSSVGASAQTLGESS